MNSQDRSQSLSTSSSLLRRAQAREAEAWRRLVQLYGPLVYGWARSGGMQPADAADVAQDVFREVHVHIDTFEIRRPGGGFRGWLWTITRNKVRDHYRQAKRRPQSQGGTTALQKWQELPESAPDETTDRGQKDLHGLRARSLELIRQQFEPRVWQAFWRAAVEGEPVNDIADDLGISNWAVYKAKARVLQRLRSEVGELLDD